MPSQSTYFVAVQASPEEILNASSPAELNFEQLAAHPGIRGFAVALPDIEQATLAAERLSGWKIPSLIGDTYNVANRILDLHDRFFDQDFCVRVLAIWKEIDFDYVDRMVNRMRLKKPHAVLAPKDYEVTMSADVLSLEALRQISCLQGSSPEVKRAHFNPWGYLDTHSEKFEVYYEEPAPMYDIAQRNAVLESGRCHPENEYFGRDYSGSRYHFLLPFIYKSDHILDIACGSGLGSHLLSQTASAVVGVDYLHKYIDLARLRFSENPKLKFMEGDGQTFLYQGVPEQFDLVISLHTLEHVPDDRMMLSALRNNLKPGGRLIAEVPLLAKRPLGVPINPYHLREYQPDDFIQLVKSSGFRIEKTIGACRGFYVPIEKARDAIQVHAIKV